MIDSTSICAVLDEFGSLFLTIFYMQGVTSKDANPYVETYRALLTDVGKLLTDHKIVWHITFGTLIGAF